MGHFAADSKAISIDGGPYFADLLVTVPETVVKVVHC